jgi:hypothetical protein
VDKSKVSFVGRFVDGEPTGNFWLKMVGGGSMHGRFGEDQMAYVYPDLETALLGDFRHFVMKKSSRV